MFNKVLSLLVEVFVGVSIITIPCKNLDFDYLQFYETVSRRERYRDLTKQCQMMHSSIGTSSFAYVVASKVMDMRTSSKDEAIREAKEESRKASTNHCDWNNNCTDTSYECQTLVIHHTKALVIQLTMSARGEARIVEHMTHPFIYLPLVRAIAVC